MINTILITLADATTAPAPNGFANSIIPPMVCMGVIIYFMLIRPQNKRQKELAAQVSALKTGDKVVTSGGIHGIISNVKEGNSLMLKIADNVKIEVDKSAITTVISNEKPAEKTAVTA